MNEECWSTVNFYVLLNGSLFSEISAALEASIHESEECSETIECEEFNNWPVDVEHHSTN